MRLVGGDDHLYPNSLDVMQWLADSNLLEMIVDKLNDAVSGCLKNLLPKTVAFGLKSSQLM